MTGELRAQLQARPPIVPDSLRGLRPRVASLGIARRRYGWQAAALVSDGLSNYELLLEVVAGPRWLVGDVHAP